MIFNSAFTLISEVLSDLVVLDRISDFTAEVTTKINVELFTASL
jgi:hypothetical protein